MKVLMSRERWEWLKEMKAEARTASTMVSTYPLYNDGREIELEIKEVQK